MLKPECRNQTEPGFDSSSNAARRVDGLTEISVADQGIGIPSNELDRIWDRLYRGDLSRSKRGLGLGLSFVKAIVEAHGRTVRAESEVNTG